ncbi:MAG TPA: hypothetical protein VFZ34_05710 [Blastocatellia bacterium]|nr:hypothetical protein [Blastocatellia bacterium]
MRTATVQTKAYTATKDDNLWQEFQQAVTKRNFVRAAELGRILHLDASRLRSLQRDALRQFLVEYQNFDGATRLCAEYCITTEELIALTDEALSSRDLASSTTFSMHTGKPTYRSIADQVRHFVALQTARLRRHGLREKLVGGWKKGTALIRSWFERLFTPKQGGGFPHGGLAWQ